MKDVTGLMVIARDRIMACIRNSLTRHSENDLGPEARGYSPSWRNHGRSLASGPGFSRVMLHLNRMNVNLTSVRAKLSRSQEHAQTFKTEFMAWSERNPYSLIKKRNADCTRHSIIIHVNEPPPIQRWSLLIADSFHNLRNALDHLIYAIATHEASPNKPPHERSLQFPITDSKDSFEIAIKRYQLGAISDPVRSAIENAQPYNRAHPTLPPLFSVLRDFTNSDKHKLLHLALTTPIQGNIGFSGNLPEGANCIPVPFAGEINDETEIFAMVCDRPAPEMDFDRHIFDVVVSIQHNKRDLLAPDWTGRTEFAALYRDMSSLVRGVIYEVASRVK